MLTSYLFPWHLSIYLLCFLLLSYYRPKGLTSVKGKMDHALERALLSILHEYSVLHSHCTGYWRLIFVWKQGPSHGHYHLVILMSTRKILHHIKIKGGTLTRWTAFQWHRKDHGCSFCRSSQMMGRLFSNPSSLLLVYSLALFWMKFNQLYFGWNFWELFLVSHLAWAFVWKLCARLWKLDNILLSWQDYLRH